MNADNENSATAIPSEQYRNLQLAYDYFNNELFDGQLRQCMITLHGKGKKWVGLFHANQWGDGNGETLHEITLSPTWLSRPLRDTLSTLVHEMVHLWQQDHGKPSRNGYHNKEWGTKMKLVGLYPSSTREPGGKETGQKVSHFIIEGGPYAEAFSRIPDNVALPWIGVESLKQDKDKPNKNKVAYQCPGCEAKAWGKPDLHLKCGDCDQCLVIVE